MTTIVILLILTLGISFICSLLEAVILSVNSAFVGVLVENKKGSGKLLESLIEKIDRPISAILTLNTVSHTLGSAFIAFRVQKLYGDEYVTIVSVILVFCILFFSEILPKSIGAANWKALAPFTAYTVQAMIVLLYPLVVTSEKLGNFFKRIEETPELTREEMIMTAEIGAEEGTLKAKESMIIKNLLMLDKIFVSDVMTPRSVFFALDGKMTTEEVAQKYKPIRFSRVPVYTGSLDNIIGVTHRYKILESLSHDQIEKKINELIIPVATISERMTVSHVLDFFIKEKEHLALAADEYGVITGLVTLEDAVETLLGVEIVDEFDNVEDMRKYALEQWQIRKQKLRKT